MAIIVLLKSVAVEEVKLVEAHDTLMKDIRTKLNWRNGEECASEFMCKILIPVLDECYNLDSSNLFTSHVQNCWSCRHCSFERLQDSIEILTTLDIIPTKVKASVSDLVQHFLNDSFDDPQFCSVCSSVLNRKIVFLQLPQCIVVQIKRVTFSHDQPIKCQTQIDISSYLFLCNYQYKLTSAVVHLNSTSVSGHYVAYRNLVDSWRLAAFQIAQYVLSTCLMLLKRCQRIL